jgi:hypothetical protein
VNDADWLRKHLRGKVQRSAVQTPTQSKLKDALRRVVVRVLRGRQPNQSDTSDSAR